PSPSCFGASVSTVCPSPQPFSNWLEFPGELKGKRKLDGHSRVPSREGGNDISQTSALSQALCQVLHSSNLPDAPPPGTDHLATIMHDLGPQLGRKVSSRGPRKGEWPLQPPSWDTQRPDLTLHNTVVPTHHKNWVPAPLHFLAPCPDPWRSPSQIWDYSLPLCPSCLPSPTPPHPCWVGKGLMWAQAEQ
uniref:Uncharacterized protein n=1 Tax=Canis lupus familiaris TaxID=9615 RepID=A0A8I3PGR7_CANLF